MQNISHLYRITDQATGRFYVGKHTGQMQNGYLGSGVRWLRHIRKNKAVDLKYEVLVISNTDYILDLESRYVTLDFIASNPLCMNLKQGGMGGIGLSKDSLESMRSKLRGKPSWNKGIPMSAEAKAKLSAAKMGSVAPNKGKPMSEEAKAKVSLTKQGVKLSEQHIQKLRAAKLGTKHSEETKQKMRASHAARKQGATQ